MHLLSAVILGIVQGLTEFFPISSSTHLAIFKHFLRVESEEIALSFDLACHLGTLCVVIVTFRREIVALFRDQKQKFIQLILALLPLIPAYFVFKPLRQSMDHFPGLSITLTITAVLLFGLSSWQQRAQLKNRTSIAPEEITISMGQRIRHALCIGSAQAAALIPGISRSASTITCAHLLGWKRKDAVQFSFLLAIPTISGGACMEMMRLDYTSVNFIDALPCCLIGFIASAIAGALMIKIAFQLLQKRSLRFFATYCLCLAILIPWIFEIL
jgi:undecaprenyl-diphosphatase